MPDPRTLEYIKKLNKAIEQNKKVTDMAEQICICNACIEARMKKTISPCELNKKLQEVHDAIIPPVPGHYTIDADPAHWRNQKTIRMTRPAF